MTRPIGVVLVALALSGCPIADAAPAPGGTCPAVRAEETASDGTALVCDEHGRWRRARYEGGSR